MRTLPPSARPPKVKRPPGEPKLVILLAPATQELSDKINAVDINPKVQITVKPDKTIRFIIDYITEKRLGKKFEIMFLRNGLNEWTKGLNDDVTLEKVYETLNNPEVFMLLYDIQPLDYTTPQDSFDDNDDPFKDVFFVLDPPPQRGNDNKKCKTCSIKSSILFLCGGCKETIYCSRYCQKKDWKRNHKSSCSSSSEGGLPSSSSSTTGTQGMLRGIKTQGL